MRKEASTASLKLLSSLVFVWQLIPYLGSPKTSELDSPYEV
jgi:hypothetical protein